MMYETKLGGVLYCRLCECNKVLWSITRPRKGEGSAQQDNDDTWCFFGLPCVRDWHPISLLFLPFA